MAIVIMIIGGLLSLALPRMGLKKIDNRTVFRNIVITVKEIRNRARLYNTSYRIAFKIDEKGGNYWVEKSSSPTLLDKNFLEKEREQKERDEKGVLVDEKNQISSPFQTDTSYSKGNVELPNGYHVKSLESGPQDVTFTEGVGYIHIFPQGLVEPIALQIVDPKKNIWTLVFNSITGQADIIDGAKSLKDLSR